MQIKAYFMVDYLMVIKVREIICYDGNMKIQGNSMTFGMQKMGKNQNGLTSE